MPYSMTVSCSSCGYFNNSAPFNWDSEPLIETVKSLKAGASNFGKNELFSSAFFKWGATIDDISP
ncbi:hypothetical protein D3C79_1060050 [compost metagenome]